MILGVDIGGTKTLIGAFSEDGELINSVRFETPKEYSLFLEEFAKSYSTFKNKEFSTVVVAVPGRLDRSTGIALEFGNLPWKNVKIQEDISNITGGLTRIENDTKLAALYEANCLSPVPDRVLYVTISTGVSSGLVFKGKLDEAMLDSESGRMLLPTDNGELTTWESFASGKAIVAKYGKRASDITDESSWKEISHNISLGLVELCAVVEPDVIIIGGGVGTHFKKFESYLVPEVINSLPDMVKHPQIIGANNAEEAALRGCFELAKQRNKLND